MFGGDSTTPWKKFEFGDSTFLPTEEEEDKDERLVKCIMTQWLFVFVVTINTIV